MNHTLFKLTGMLLVSLFSFTGLYFLKISLNQMMLEKSNAYAFLKIMPNLILQGKFWLALLGYGTALTIYLFLLQEDEVSRVFTMSVGINILLTTLGATLFLGDTLNITRLMGITLIIAGIFFIYEH